MFAIYCKMLRVLAKISHSLGFVTSDKESVLLYFRIRREGARATAKGSHCNRARGTFYLPYRRFYDANDVFARIHEFLRAKCEHLVQLFDKNTRKMRQRVAQN